MKTVTKTVTYEIFLTFKPCWLDDEEKAEQLKAIGDRHKSWTALDVLDLPNDEVSDEDKLWTALREEFIDAPILHEFACRCAERALSRVGNPDLRSGAAIAAKRSWLRGEINDEQLSAARSAAWDAAQSTAWSTAWNAAQSAAQSAARSAARSAAWDAAQSAAQSAARRAARSAAWDAARSAAYRWQADELRRMLVEAEAEK